MANKSQLSGMRGVYLVAAELVARGFIVSVTSRSAAGADLLVIGRAENVNAAGLPHNKEELTSHINAFMEKLMQLPERVRNYFQHPCMQYAAAD